MEAAKAKVKRTKAAEARGSRVGKQHRGRLERGPRGTGNIKRKTTKGKWS